MSNNNPTYTPQELLEKINAIFPDAKHIAVDCDSPWWDIYDKPKPKEEHTSWGTEGSVIISIEAKYIDYQGSWEDSLHSIEEDEIPDENTPSGTPVQPSYFKNSWPKSDMYFVGVGSKKDGRFVCRNSLGELQSFPYCRIKKG